MNHKYKTREALINELKELQIEHNSLKKSYESDITERKLAEDALRESEEKWRKLAGETLQQETENFRHSLDNSPLGVRIATAEGYSIYANKTLLNYYGYESLEELQKTSLMDRYTPESYLQAQKRKRQREQGDFSITDYEISIIRKDGVIRHLLVFRKEVLWDGIRQFQVIYNDITELRRSEEALIESETRFRRAILEAPIPMLIHDEDDHCYQISKGWTKFSGYTLEDIPTIGDWTTRAFGERSRYVKDHINKTFNINETISNGEWNITTKDGHTRIWDFYATPIGLSTKGKRLLLSIAIDITENKLADKELKIAHEQLKQLYTYQDELIENERTAISREIHDELGQLLSALKIDLSWTKNNAGNEPEFKKRIKSMTDIVSDTIKIVQRISSDLRPGLLDDLGLVPAMEWYIQEFEKRTGIKCHFLSDDIQFPNEKKNLTLYRILQETLTNVVRHAKAKSVNINLYRVGDSIFLEIIDDGIGMKQQKIDSHKSLGFIGIRERVNQFNGSLDISSANDKGTKLSIRIPFN